MRLTFCSQLIFVFSFVLILSQWQIGVTAASKQDETTPTPLSDETTTKKSGFFGGLKKLFSRSSTTTAAPIDQSTTASTANVHTSTTAKSIAATTPPAGKTLTTAKPNPTPTIKKQAVPPSNPLQTPGFGSGAPPPGFPQFKPQKPLPSGLELSYGGGEVKPPPRGIHPSVSPANGMKTDSASSTTTTTANVNNAKGATTPSSPSISNGPTFAATTVASAAAVIATTTIKPAPPKEDFPPLPSPKHPPSGFNAVTPSTPSATTANVWNRPNSPQPGSIPQIPTGHSSNNPSNGVSFVPHSEGSTTVRPGFPTDKPQLATDDEIRQFTEDLYNKEVASQISRIQVHLQGITRSIDSTDEAPQPLLEVQEQALETPTIVKMRALFNNYEMDAGINEHVSPRERDEEKEFVEAITTTALMRHAMLFLQNKGVVTSDPKTHMDLLKELWFTQYSRLSGKVGSSGFEHVFANEVKNGTIIGLHNWVYFYEQEKAGKLDYKGYLKSVDLGQKGKVVKVRFSHNGNNKPVNTLFIGTSPELEMALYTVCHKIRPDRTCPVSLGGTKFGIVTYSWRHRGKDLIGSAFPEI